jgi:site-specific recombinase XerD
LIEIAGIENFRFHGLRQHFASRLVQSGIDLDTVRELLGHADITMVLRYAHMSPDRLCRSALDGIYFCICHRNGESPCSVKPSFS